MKKITVTVKDGTDTKMSEDVNINHLSDLSGEVKEVMDDFLVYNHGSLMPPVTIEAKTAKKSPPENSGEEARI